MQKSIFRSVAFWIIFVELVGVIILWKAGFAITYSPDIDYAWDAIAAIGEWAGVFIGILIPIAAIYVEHKLQANERSMGEANALLFDELKEYKAVSMVEINTLKQRLSETNAIMIELEKRIPTPMTENDINAIFEEVFSQNNVRVEKTDKEKRDELKEEVLKFVNISMVAKTSQVAKHLDIEDKIAWEILRELCMHDRKIDSGGPIKESDYDRNIWLKKKIK